jgi:hypothetical protein
MCSASSLLFCLCTFLFLYILLTTWVWSVGRRECKLLIQIGRAFCCLLKWSTNSPRAKKISYLTFYFWQKNTSIYISESDKQIKYLYKWVEYLYKWARYLNMWVMYLNMWLRYLDMRLMYLYMRLDI